MKILFVDDHAGLQEKWIEPLRGEGWGVVRTRSADDAEKVFEFHGDSLDALIVSEAHAEWAQKWNIPYIVMKTTWKDVQVMKHQNSAEQPAFAYLDFDSNFDLFRQAVVDARSTPVKKNLKPTGTGVIQSSAIQSSAIESAMSQASESAEEKKENTGGIVIQFDQYSGQKVEIESTSLGSGKSNQESAVESPVVNNDATKILDSGTNPDILKFLNEDKQQPGADDFVPHEVLSSAVQEMGGEALPQREVTRVYEEESNADATTIQSSISLSVGEAASSESVDEEIQFMEAPEQPSEQATFHSSIPNPPAFSSSLGVDRDLETMKNYLALREQDVMVLTGQMRSAQERVRQLESMLKEERSRNSDLSQTVQKQDQQIKSFERDKQVEFEVLFNQIEDLNFQIREKTDKVRTFETKLKITSDEVDKVKERVRVDIRRIRVREKELENQLEILKKDSTALLMARDEKILELKRKIDLLEFNMELVQEQHNKERNVSEQLRQKLKEAAGVMKRAGGLLDHEN